MSDAGHQATQRIQLGRLFRSGAVYTASDAAMVLVALLLLPLYTHRLSSAEYGLFGVMTALRQVLLPIIGLGLVASFRTLYHAGSLEQRRRLVPTVVNAGLAYSVLTTTVLSVLLASYFTFVGDGLPFRTHALLTLWTAFASASYFLPLTIFQMEGRSGRYAAYNVSTSVLLLVSTVVLVGAFDGGIIGALVAQLISAAFGFAVAGLVVRDRWAPLVDRGQLRTILRLALPTLPHTLAVTAARFSDRLLLTTLATLSAAGTYTVAALIASVVPLALGGLSTAFAPEFYRRTAANDPELPGDWRRMLTVFVVILAWASLTVSIFTPVVLDVVATADYAGAVSVTPLLVLGNAMMAITWHFSPGVDRAHRTWAFPAASIPALVLNVVLNLMLIPSHGAIGAAVAFACASALQMVIFCRLSLRGFHFPVNVRSLLLTSAIAIGLYALARGGRELETAWSLAINSLIVVAFPALVLAARVVRSTDLRRALRIGSSPAAR